MQDRLDETKIEFIMCVNNDIYADESIRYINRLEIPNGYSINITKVYDAKSMTSGYNDAMKKSDAKYKVYLHQDVFIVNKNFLYEILRCFENSRIGMLGIVGGENIPESIVPWTVERVGKIYTSNIKTSSLCRFDKLIEDDLEVSFIDGLLMVTQYDIAWREDIFLGWDFYDLSQCQEFIRHGYKVVVPYQEDAWVIHDDGYLNLINYYKDREIFKKEYID